MKGSLLLSPRSRHRLYKTFHNFRVTLLCSLLTFVVLRSSLGAGKFGTPVQDYDEIRHHLHNFRLRHQQKLLLIKRELAAAELTLRKDASQITLSLPTLPSVELEGSFIKSTFSLPTLPVGKLEGTGNVVVDKEGAAGRSAPRIMLVTASTLAKCQSAVEAQFLLKFLKNKMDYCHLHGFEIFFAAETDTDSDVAKSRLLHKLILSHPEVEWIWWMDSTAMVTNMSHRLPFDRYTGHNVVKHSLRGGGYGVGRSMLVRNCEWTLEYLADAEQWTQPATEILVDMEVNGPKVGLRNAWPFITDFKSCNVCGKEVDLSCLSHIEGAYSFADSQHKHVASL